MRREQKVLIEEWIKLDEAEGCISNQILHLHEELLIAERRNGKIRQEKAEILQSSEFDGTSIHDLIAELKAANEKGEDPCQQDSDERKQQQVYSGLDYSAVNTETNTVPFRLKVRSDRPFSDPLPDK